MNAPGPRGPKGDKGDRGARGPRLPPGTAYAVVFLFLFALALGAVNLAFTAHYVHATQAAQRRQGLMVEQKICTTLHRITALQPPAGDPATNPSRAYDQRLHVTLAQLAPDLGCTR